MQLQIILAVPLTSGVYILSVTTPQGVTDDQSFEMADLATPVPRVRCGVVFASCGEGNADIYTMTDNGTDITKLTENPVGDWKPTWSPGKIYSLIRRDMNEWKPAGEVRGVKKYRFG